MEANLQEVVLEGDLFQVLGGHNGLSQAEEIQERCLKPRPYSQVRADQAGKLTGFRLCRKPATLR